MVDAIRKYFSEPGRAEKALFDGAVADLRALVASMGRMPIKGSFLEQLVFVALQRHAKTCTTVGALPFVAGGAKSPHSSPVVAWWDAASFAMRGFVRRGVQGVGKDDKPEQTTTEFLADASHEGELYVPETVARADGVLMLRRANAGDPRRALTLGVTIWSGLVPAEKVRSQFRSTSMALAYYIESGDKVNRNCREERAAWEAEGLDRVRAVRVHVTLPRFGEGQLAKCVVDGDELAVHLDASTVHLLLGDDREAPGLRRVLALATRTSVEEWGGA